MMDTITDCGSRAHFSEAWTDLLDRGGLVHVSDDVYELFHVMEVELRPHLRPNGDAFKERAIQEVAGSERVLNIWSTISRNWGREEAQELLKAIVEHWVTNRGFSFASALVEKYKQLHKKTVQKSMGLRKNLIGKSVTITGFDNED